MIWNNSSVSELLLETHNFISYEGESEKWTLSKKRILFENVLDISVCIVFLKQLQMSFFWML
jgi:hypothetical protein